MVSTQAGPELKKSGAIFAGRAAPGAGGGQEAVDNLGVLPDFVLAPGEHADINAIDRLDALKGGAKSLLAASFVFDASGSQDLESKAGLGGLA